MPTMPERMAVVEIKVTNVETTVTSIDQKVDELIQWRNEERGARQQRALTKTRLVGIVGVLSSLFGAASALVLKLLGGA